MVRAVCFGRPLAPWRECRKQVARDLIERGLGSYDERGRFFITVPGDIETRQALVVVVDDPPPLTFVQRARSRDRRLGTAPPSRVQFRYGPDC